MNSLLHAIHSWQHAAQLWLETRNPATVDFAMLLAMTLEGMGIPGIPGEIPMLAQAGLIDSGSRTYVHAALVGTTANFAGSLLGYLVGGYGNRWIPDRWRDKLSDGSARLTQSKHIGWLVLVSRSFGALRTPVTWGAGAARYPFGLYAFWALLGAAVHVFIWQYVLWRGTGFLTHLHPRKLLWVLAVALPLAVAWWLYRRRQADTVAALPSVVMEAEAVHPQEDHP